MKTRKKLGLGRRSEKRDVRPIWAACAALLDYPDERLIEGLDGIAALVPDDPHLQPVIEHLRTHSLRELQVDYVKAFDLTRKCSPYLTYFSHGDTRRRGLALVEFKETYRAAGVEFDPSEDELPDHLSVVLQFGALVDTAGALKLLLDHRAGVEMLRLALENFDDGDGSPWWGVVAAVCATLPPLDGDEADAVRRLVEAGPPAEEVGLGGYGDPALQAPPAAGPTLISSARIPVGAP